MSRFVDTFTFAENGGGSKKEININLGDIVARETANEAKVAAVDALQKATGAPTDNYDVNRIILACSTMDGNDAVPLALPEGAKFRLYVNRDDSGTFTDLEIENADDSGEVHALEHGYNWIYWSSLDVAMNLYVNIGVLEDNFITPDDVIDFAFTSATTSEASIALMTALYRIDSAEDAISMSFEQAIEAQEVAQEAKEMANSSIEQSNEALTRSIDVVPNLEAIVALYNHILQSVPLDIDGDTAVNVYRNKNSVQIEGELVSMVNNPTRFTNDLNVEDIYSIDLRGISNVKNLFGELYNGSAYRRNPDRPLRVVSNIKGLDKVSMQYMFAYLKNLKIVEFGHATVPTLSISLMYSYCSALESVDMSNLAVGMCNMLGDNAFDHCYNLKSVKFPNITSSNFTIGRQVFYDCRSLKELDLSSINCKVSEQQTTGITGNLYIFSGCISLETLNMNNWDFSQVSMNSWRELNNLPALKNFSGLQSMPVSYSLKGSPLLTYESAINCINGLYDLTEGGTVEDYTSQTLTLHENVYAQLEDTDIAIAVEKGWSIVES